MVRKSSRGAGHSEEKSVGEVELISQETKRGEEGTRGEVRGRHRNRFSSWTPLGRFSERLVLMGRAPLMSKLMTEFSKC